jgi:hypothetical protein
MSRVTVPVTEFNPFVHFLFPFSVQDQLVAKKMVTLEAAENPPSVAEPETLQIKGGR